MGTYRDALFGIAAHCPSNRPVDRRCFGICYRGRLSSWLIQIIVLIILVKWMQERKQSGRSACQNLTLYLTIYILKRAWNWIFRMILSVWSLLNYLRNAL